MKNTLNVAVMGDICMEEYQEKMDAARAKGLLQEIKPLLESVDLRIANLENAITEPLHPIAKCGPNLWQKPENLCFFREAEVELCVLANNHTGDFGPEGILDTMRTLDEQGYGHAGAGKNLDAAYRPWYRDTEAGRLAVCAFCENEFGGATLDTAGTAGFDLHRVAKALREARENADFVLVIMHGGTEYNPVPSPGVQSRYRTFVDLGADAVVGMHTHCMQGYEIYRGAPIVYSTGNFLFRGHPESLPSWFCGYVAELTFRKDGLPTVTLHPYRFDLALTCIHLLEGAEKAVMLAYLQRLSGYLADERALREWFDGWCMLSGPAHAAYAFEEKYLDETHFPKGHPMLAVRNIRTCEAHNEMVTNLCRMMLEGRTAQGRAKIPEILEVQKMPL